MVSQSPISQKLELIVRLFDTLHSSGIRYCHWKSNEHLDASFEGDTDLDILFDHRQRERIESVLLSIGFKRFLSIKEKEYKDIVDFIGLDEESGKIVHIHTHFRLTMGEAYLKGYQLGLEDLILKSRVFDEKYGIYVIDPHYELVLLFIRESLKLRFRDRFFPLGGKACGVQTLKEYYWLVKRTNYRDLYATIRKIFFDADAAYKIISLGMTPRHLRVLSRQVKSEFKQNRLYNPINATLTRWYREVSVRGSRKLAQLLHRPILSRRISPRGGRLVAVVGADGSGKSTVTENLRRTFGNKLDTFKIYFGRGDGNMSFFRRILSWFKPRRSLRASAQLPADVRREEGFAKVTFKCLEAVVVAREKISNMRRADVARKKGALVICDRFPQIQVMGYNDGPLLSNYLNSGNSVLRAIARYEINLYKQVSQYAPDLVFKLIADADVVEARKPNETSREKLEAKIQSIKSMTFGDRSTVVTIDAVRPLSDVLKEVKMRTWHEL